MKIPSPLLFRPLKNHQSQTPMLLRRKKVRKMNDKVFSL
jgi:hypothetical protein